MFGIYGSVKLVRKKKKKKEICKGFLDVYMQVLCRFLAEGHTVHGQGKLCEAQKSVAAER